MPNKTLGKLTIAHPGTGTVGHLLALLLAQEAGIQTALISYSGSAQALGDILGQHVDLGSFVYGSHLNTATLLAVASSERFSSLPNIPTMKESGLANVAGSTWFGVFAPAGLPNPIAAKLNKVINDFLNKEETKNKFTPAGVLILGGSSERLKNQIEDDQSRWAKVIQAAGLDKK